MQFVWRRSMFPENSIRFSKDINSRTVEDKNFLDTIGNIETFIGFQKDMIIFLSKTDSFQATRGLLVCIFIS